MRHFLDVDPSSGVPIWRQIEDGMRRLVASERVPSGSAVPSVRELARALRVNPATVSKAYRRLSEDGLLTVRRGEGTFVGERDAREIEKERGLLLADGAGTFIRLARSVGASREQATRVIAEQWNTVAGGGEGGAHGG